MGNCAVREQRELTSSSNAQSWVSFVGHVTELNTQGSATAVSHQPALACQKTEFTVKGSRAPCRDSSAMSEMQ